LGVGPHERGGHRDTVPVRKDIGRPTVPEIFDDTEQVIPSTSIQTGSVVPQLIENLVHLEDGGNRLDEHGGPYCAVLDSQCTFGMGEDVVPPPRLLRIFQFWQIEVRSTATLEQFPGIVEKVETKIYERPDGFTSIDLDIVL